MEKTLIDLASADGIWAMLFVFLFLYVLYDSRKREMKYQDTISKNQTIMAELSKKFGILWSIQKDVTDIKESLRK